MPNSVHIERSPDMSCHPLAEDQASAQKPATAIKRTTAASGQTEASSHKQKPVPTSSLCHFSHFRSPSLQGKRNQEQCCVDKMSRSQSSERSKSSLACTEELKQPVSNHIAGKRHGHEPSMHLSQPPLVACSAQEKVEAYTQPS